MASPFHNHLPPTGHPEIVDSTEPGPFISQSALDTPKYASGISIDPLPSNRPAHLAAQNLHSGGFGFGPSRDMIPICGPDTNNLDLSRHLLFTLEPGEKKIEVEEDSRVPNTSIFTLNKEDHTLGNLLSSRLRSKPYITFAGYKAPHPLIAKVELRVGTDGSITPKDAVIEVCKEIMVDLETVSNEFAKELELYNLHKQGIDGEMEIENGM